MLLDFLRLNFCIIVSLYCCFSVHESQENAKFGRSCAIFQQKNQICVSFYPQITFKTSQSFSLTGHDWVRGSDWQVSGAVRVPLQQDQRPRRLRDGLWWEGMPTFNFLSLQTSFICSQKWLPSVHVASFASVYSVSLRVTWLARCVLWLCVGWMPFLPLAASIMCCYYV